MVRDDAARLCAVRDRAALAPWMQDYLADLARWSGERPDARGRWRHCRYLPLYGREPDRWAFWLCRGGQRAGFALVRRLRPGRFEMSEFYIAPPHRGTGFAHRAAAALLARFPADWRIAQLPGHAKARRFWQRVAAHAAAGACQSRVLDDGRTELAFAVSPTPRTPVDSL